MIETTYIPLAKAAGILDVDAETLLIAAAERRIQLYWLLNAVLSAEKGLYEKRGTRENGDEELSWFPHDHGIQHFLFVPLLYKDAAELLKNQTTKWWGRRLSLIDEDHTFWALMNEEKCAQELGPDWDQISRDIVYLTAADVKMLKSESATPAPGTIKDPVRPSKPVPRDNNLVAIIAALLAVWPRRKWPSAKELEEAAKSVDVSVSDDTIRKGLEAAKTMAPSLSPPK